jgi:dihydropteroate synthase
MVQHGAQILDVGGESSRPGSTPVDLATEQRRVLPVMEALHREGFPACLSVDTWKAALARQALERGAPIVNDISALRDPQMAGVTAAHGAGLVLMHMRGVPKTMQQGDLRYEVITDIRTTLQRAIHQARQAGVPPSHIMLDPGIGFGKTTAQNIQITQSLGALTPLGHPIVYGPSRKRFIGELTGQEVANRDRGTAATCAIAALQGAHIFRVHNPAEVRDALAIGAGFRSPA